ncbi:MAG: hypothetical protein Q4A98_10955 [Comamonadaceae bacterium]|nr:hypothetical protein [Comamonadaceae bacterium]
MNYSLAMEQKAARRCLADGRNATTFSAPNPHQPLHLVFVHHKANRLFSLNHAP